MKELALTLVLSTCVLLLNGQTPADRSFSNVYLEAGGSALLVSTNYERVFYLASSLRTASRLGIGLLPYNSKQWNGGIAFSYSAPFTQSLLYGDDFQFELGGGVTFLVHTSKDINHSQHASRYITGIFGARYQNYDSGLLIRMVFTPFIDQDEFYYWFGISLGTTIGKIQADRTGAN